MSLAARQWKKRCCGDAALYTLLETCKLNGIDPQAWLADVLARLPDYPARRSDQLLPWHWKTARKALA